MPATPCASSSPETWRHSPGLASGSRSQARRTVVATGFPVSGFSPVELDLSEEERSVLVGALRTFWRDFPYSDALRLAVANQVKQIIERGRGESEWAPA